MHAASRTTTCRLLRQATRPPSGFICSSCLSRRTYSTPTSTRPQPPLPPPPPPAAGFAALKSRRLLSVSGPDATGYLQGVVTANIVNNPNPGFYTAFLNAQGRVLHDVFVYRHDGSDSFLIEVDAAEAERLVRQIKRYKLRAKFNVRLLDAEEATVWQAWDDSRTGLTLPTGGMTTSVQDPRSPTLGYRILTHGDPAQAAPQLELDQTPETSYRIRRYLHGVAEGQAEILREHALPAESNMDLTGAIDFRKGCYVGQELTIRTRHRGVVRKRILPCVLYSNNGSEVPEQLVYNPDSPAAADAVPPETSIGRAEKKGRSTGKWLSGVGNVGLALCRIEVMTDLTLPGEPPATPPAAGALGSGDKDEFVMIPKTGGEDGGSDGPAVKVKAFVPQWLRQGLAAQAAGH